MIIISRRKSIAGPDSSSAGAEPRPRYRAYLVSTRQSSQTSVQNVGRKRYRRPREVAPPSQRRPSPSRRRWLRSPGLHRRSRGLRGRSPGPRRSSRGLRRRSPGLRRRSPDFAAAVTTSPPQSRAPPPPSADCTHKIIRVLTGAI